MLSATLPWPGGTALLAFLAAGGGDRPAIDFNRDVRPILSQNCYACHGPDTAAREARLRFDRPQEDLAERGIVVPGAPLESELFLRVAHPDADERMPPPESKKELDPEAVLVLKRWIQEGAPYDEHWAFQPLTETARPQQATETPAQESNPIDSFVQERLAEAGLSPSPEATRRKLIRRLSLDLAGLPPTPAEIRSFLEDERPDAYERVVDRLLASPAHAERMTLAWLDAARYGDTSVFHADGPRVMWPWRDWVLNAYQNNMPFDRFTIEQLAGDLLPNATRDQKIASGFLRNNGTSDEGGAIDEEFRVRYMVDRVKTVSNVWLGLSMECAQCHEHKFDPITTEDYYSFFAFFNQSVERGMQTRNGNEAPFVEVPSPEQEANRAQLVARIAELETYLDEVTLPATAMREWSDQNRAALADLPEPDLGTWHRLAPFSADSSKVAFETEYGPERLTTLDPAIPVADKRWEPRPDWADGQVHALNLPDNSAAYLARTLHAPEPMQREISLGSDDTLGVWLNGKSLLQREVYRGTQPDQDRVTLDLQAGSNLLLIKVCNGAGPSGFYFRLLGLPLPDRVVAALRPVDRLTTVEGQGVLEAYYRREVWGPGRALVKEATSLRNERDALAATIPTVMVMADLPDGRPTYVLDRGQYDAPQTDRVVEPNVPAFLPALPEGTPRNRLGLAQWLMDPRHPLTARVAVNRYWALLFGRGLVQTVMDFGSQGTWPTHPALLDWLAEDFRSNGWDVRRTLKTIVLSQTYRQASQHRADLVAQDPENELLGRAPRFRLQGEFVRDQALSVSGLLAHRFGGPGVRPYQPPGLWNEVSLDKNVRFEQGAGDDLYRRSMYIYWKRSAPMPAMTIFDAPTREKCVVQRQRTNTPLQALVTLNDVQFVEAARHLAKRLLRSAETTSERLALGFELCTARTPEAAEIALLEKFLNEQLALFGEEPERATELLAVGDSPRDTGLEASEHAAWTLVASMLLNLDETLTRE